MWHLSLLLVLSLMLSNQQVCKCAAGLSRWKTLSSSGNSYSTSPVKRRIKMPQIWPRKTTTTTMLPRSQPVAESRDIRPMAKRVCVCVCTCVKELFSSAWFCIPHTHAHTHTHTHTHTHSHSPPFKMSPRWSMRWWWKCHLVLIHLSSLIQPHEFLPLVFNHFCSFTTRPFECGDS